MQYAVVESVVHLGERYPHEGITCHVPGRRIWI